MDKSQLLRHAKSKGATDIHICPEAPILFRLGGNLIPVTKEPLTAEQSRQLSMKFLNEEQKEQLQENLDYDFMTADGTGRYRINIGFFNGEVGTSIRILPTEPKSIEELYLHETVKDLAVKTKGLVLITGSTSQGKTTTMAAMINHLNQKSKKHIITIEDPIEYLHKNNTSIIRQRQVGTDTKSFANGLRAALRQDPDVIAIGEMRDYETIRTALTAAETGVLVLSTLHVISIDKLLERFLSYAPASDENQIRYLLAESLQGIIHQELLTTKDKQQRVATEILVVTNAAKNIIRRRGSYFLRGVIETGKKHGMISMQESVNSLLEQGIITEGVAKSTIVNYQ